MWVGEGLRADILFDAFHNVHFTGARTRLLNWASAHSHVRKSFWKTSPQTSRRCMLAKLLRRPCVCQNKCLAFKIKYHYTTDIVEFVFPKLNLSEISICITFCQDNIQITQLYCYPVVFVVLFLIPNSPMSWRSLFFFNECL